MIFALLATLGANAQQVSVSGQLSGIETNGMKMSVSSVSGNNLIPLDTLTLKGDGNFAITAPMTKPTMLMLKFDNGIKSPVHLLLEPDDQVGISLLYDSEYGFLRVTAVEGSRNMVLYRDFNNLLYQFAKYARVIDDEYNDSKTSEDRKRELSNQFMELQTSMNMEVRKLISANTDVLMAAFIVTFFENDEETYIDLYEAVENGLKEKYSDNQFVRYVSSKVMSSLGAGRMAPEIEMKDPQGNMRKLSSLRGNVVLIDFWASWCRPCRMENPNVVKLYKKYHDKGFEIYSVSLDKSREEWTKAIQQDGLIWENHVSDLNGWTSSGGASYGISSVPSTVLVDRQGRIIARNLRGQQLENKLRELFGE